MITLEAPDLTKADRCDRCSAAASSVAVGEAGSLQFCGHHKNKYVEALEDSGFVVTEVVGPVE